MLGNGARIAGLIGLCAALALPTAVFAQQSEITGSAAEQAGAGLLPLDTRDQSVIDEIREEIRLSFSSNPVGGDFLAADIADVVKRDPANTQLVLDALINASDAQRRAAARGLSAAVADLEQVGTDAAVEAAQLIAATIAQAMVCIEGGVSGDVCRGIGQNEKAFADAYNAIQSGEATAAITVLGSLPGALQFTPPASGPLGNTGDLNLDGTTSLFDITRQVLNSGNVTPFSESGAASGSPTTP